MKHFLVLIAVLLSACATPILGGEKPHETPFAQYTPYDPAADAKADIEATLAAAKLEGKHGLLVFGANWCHDSRALAAHFEKPRFEALIRSHYKLVYVDVGEKDRNIDLARKFGVDDIVGTPTVFVTSPDGKVLNLDTAPTWRNAASRDEDDIWMYFRGFAHPKL